jgi:prepilin-type N-terminal cleavage/methylation domain-containing protein
MKQRKAFTIIEVVLVLAIAGLIFLMVFIALPALQRSQRNTRRRQDISRIATAVTDYQANNNSLPFPKSGRQSKNNVDNTFVEKYISGGACTKTNTTSTGNLYYGGGATSAAFTLNAYTCTNSDQFVDPDGTVYNIWSPGIIAESIENVVFDKVDNKIPSFGDNNHLIFALANAKCGDSENKAELGNGTNDFALFYLLEGGSVYCTDNQ